MKNYMLNFVTENQRSPEKGKKVGSLICEALRLENFEISKYEKFPNSYMIALSGKIKSDLESIYESIELTDRICRPWIVGFKRNENEVSLIFNKSEFSKF